MSIHPVDAAALEWATRQHGYVTWPQLKAAGASGSLVSRRVRSGRIERRWPGVYRLPGGPETPESMLWEAQLIGGDRAVASHEAAAWWYATPAQPQLTHPVLTVPHPHKPRLPGGVVLHQTTDLAVHDVVDFDGLRLTSPARTVVDLGAVWKSPRLRATVDDWMARGDLTPDDIAAVFTRVLRPGKRGMSVVARVLDLIDVWEVPTASMLEQVMVPIVREAGIDDFEVQVGHPGYHPGHEVIDGRSLSSMLIVEGDGRRWHTRTAQVNKDHQRDLDAGARGWYTVRLGWRQLTQQRHATVEALRQLHLVRLRQLGRLQVP